MSRLKQVCVECLETHLIQKGIGVHSKNGVVSIIVGYNNYLNSSSSLVWVMESQRSAVGRG